MTEIYYLTGRGGKLTEGLGEALLHRGCDVSGREVSRDLFSLSFQEQVDLISNDIEQFWSTDSKIVAVSYGAYLLLHALMDKDSCPSNILLLSPILGGVNDPGVMKFYRPPRANKLLDTVRAGKYPKLKQLQIHVGEHDWQSIPDRGIEFSQAVGGRCIVISEKGHLLGKNYVGRLLDQWLYGTSQTKQQSL